MALHITNVHETTQAHHKGIAKELENMVFRSVSRKYTIQHLSMAFLLPFENKIFRQVDVLVKESTEAFHGVMKSVVSNQLFNKSLFKGIVERHGSDQKKPPEGEKGKDKTKSLDRGHEKRKKNPNPQSSSSSNPSKMSPSD